jgi:AcrR family transcriptional regulator
VLRRPYDTLGVAELSRRAGIGRSTFYEHFRGKHDVLRHALDPVLAPLADAAVGRGDAARVRAVIDHVAENRPRTLAMLDGHARVHVEHALTDEILARLGPAPDAVGVDIQSLLAAQLAGSQLALIRAWLAGGTGACPSPRVAAVLVETTIAPARVAPCS